MSTRSLSVARFASGVTIALAASSALLAANRFYFSAETFLTGTAGNQVEILCDNDFDALGFSFGINYDETKLTATAVTNTGTTAAGADYYEGQIHAASGLIGYGCVFDLDGDFSMQRLPTGTNHVIGILTFSVVATQDTTTTLVLEDVPIPPNLESPVRNVLTNGTGQSVVPGLENGTVTIRVEAPEIVSIQNGVGLPGHVFQITGNNFGHANLAVTVCGQPAGATLRPDGTTIDVTAPNCPQRDPMVLDCFDVTVSTVRGMDTAPDGFCYIAEPEPSDNFVRGDANSDGNIDLSDGVGILGFLFQGFAPPACRDAADSDDSGGLDLTDAVKIFNWLFLGGPAPNPPSPSTGTYPPANCGPDPTTADGLDCATLSATCD
jgi:hypothetical protein